MLSSFDQEKKEYIRKIERSQDLENTIDQEKKQVLRSSFFIYKFPPCGMD